MADGESLAGAGCSFPSGMILALQPGPRQGIIAITPGGRASRFTSLPATATPDGIIFDITGRFGHRLIVTARNHATTMVLAIDCARRSPHDHLPCPGHGRRHRRGTSYLVLP